MHKDPFLKSLEELLEDQIDSIRFEKISRDYAEREGEKAEIIKTLRNLPPTVETKTGVVNVHELLIDLDDLHYALAGISFDIGIKRGFSLAFKLILQVSDYY